MGRVESNTMGRVDASKTRPPSTVSSASYTPVATEISASNPLIVPDAFVYNNNDHFDVSRRALRMVASEYADIPETQGLSWNDDFFDDEDDVVAAFDFDYDLMESYYSSVGWCCFGLSFLYTPIFAAALFGLTPCYLRRNVQWSVQAQHVAITRDGIRFVRDKRRTCWGWGCTDAGKSSKTVPFDKITDCDLEEPAGNTCLVIPNVLVKINIDTASSGGGQGGIRHELQISGLKDAKRFKQLVWAMKRRYQQRPANLMGATAATNDDVAALLRDIRDELRQNNNLLVSLKSADSQPSAPVEEVEAQSVS